MRITSLTLLACSSLLLAVGASAQDDDARFVEAFSGEWYSFEPARSDGGGTCTFTLDATPAGAEGSRPVETDACAAPLDEIEAWRIVEGQIRLFDGAEGALVAALGGNQFRITGEAVAEESALVLERATGDANSRAIRAAVGTYRCKYLGFSDDCAEPTDLEQPDFADVPPVLRTVVNLNVRAQPRADSELIGVIPRDTTVTVDQCLVASDGLWCEARFGESGGWFARTALRLNKWPVLTFVVEEDE